MIARSVPDWPPGATALPPRSRLLARGRRLRATSCAESLPDRSVLPLVRRDRPHLR